MTEHFDVVVVGAGISGIGAAVHLQERCPDRSFVVLEGREQLGGTWDLFRYPGIRSDSDMHTLGFRFKPWKEQAAIADGDAILRYLHETVDEYHLAPRIRYGHRIVRAQWSTADARWTVEVTRSDTGQPVRFTCSFLFMCCGYYDYEQGYTPELPGAERFAGRIVHPQKWTPDIDYAGQRVIVIGSGATAVTLVPALAEQAAHVVMLQRSPTYILSRPPEDDIANRLRELLPERAAYFLSRWKNVLVAQALFQASRRAPAFMKKLLVGGVRRQLGEGYDVDTHFTPRYDPWDQRLCLVPNGDLFAAIRSGRAEVVTGHIDTFTEKGIRLQSGEELEADLIVTATGLNLKVFGGIETVVDGERVRPNQTMSYKAMMLSDVPNLALTFGYTNASWTLKADLTSEYVCRLLNHMRKHHYQVCVPRQRDAAVSEEPFVDFSSGYVRRALADLPRQGSKAPWKLFQNYLFDIFLIRYGRIDDGVMEFA
ncbi:MAG: NAD(P)/FAD-dependent oxidoreductase [Myxococcales bacterium]|nr:NAD(P)/FAD-dependent oxidoreductase [Myxococcales bacterium]